MSTTSTSFRKAKRVVLRAARHDVYVALQAKEQLFYPRFGKNAGFFQNSAGFEERGSAVRPNLGPPRRQVAPQRAKVLASWATCRHLKHSDVLKIGLS
jgi:hypothetical protein